MSQKVLVHTFATNTLAAVTKFLVCTYMIWLLITAASSATAASSLVVTGVDGDLKTNVELILGAPPLKSEARKFRRYLNDVPILATDALSALGHYGAQVKTEHTTQGDDTVVTVSVFAGDPVVIKSLNIDIVGDGLDDAAFRSVLRKITLQKQSVFISADYEANKTLLQEHAQDLGYFDFAFTSSEVRVSRRQLTADINLVADTGVRYTFGPILFEQESLRVTFLDRWVPFNENDPYESSLIGELNQNLQNSGYFKSVQVKPQQDRRYGKTIPVTVDLTLKDLNQVAVGLGFSTDSGVRTRLTWSKPIINQRGHSADFEVGLSEYDQNASFSYRIPQRHEPLYNYWGIEYGLKNARTDATESFLSTLNFQRVSRTPSQWTESWFLRWEREKSTAIDKEKTTDLILPGVSYTRSRSKGTPFPVWGQATSFQMMGGSERALSTIDFFKVVGSFRYLRAISNKNTIIAAVQYGAIQSNDYDSVPVSQRFFAGGDRSVRGFKFRDLSPRKEPDNEAVGGRYLEVLSLEYNYRFRDQWSGAIFADAGRAFNNFSSPYSVGAGFGIRWQSPVGPFRLDIATPISNNDESDIRIHLSLGPDL